MLVWKSPNPDKDSFIAEAHGLVTEAHRVLFEMKGNMEKIIKVLRAYPLNTLCVLT